MKLYYIICKLFTSGECLKIKKQIYYKVNTISKYLRRGKNKYSIIKEHELNNLLNMKE